MIKLEDFLFSWISNQLLKKLFGFQQNFTEGCGGEGGGDEERIKNNAFEKIENPEILWNAISI